MSSKTVDKSRIEFEIELIQKRINASNVKEFESALIWTNKLINLNRKSRGNALVKQKRKDKKHPIQPKRREIWTAELGVNVGVEASEYHSVLILQKNKGNEYSETVIAIPLSTLDEGERIDNAIHHKIEKFNLEEVFKVDINGKPSKVKIADITTLDKARLIEKVARVRKPVMHKINQKLINLLSLVDNE